MEKSFFTPFPLTREYFVLRNLSKFLTENDLSATLKLAEMLHNIDFNYKSMQASPYNVLSEEQKATWKGLQEAREKYPEFNLQVMKFTGAGMLLFGLVYVAIHAINPS